MAAVDTTRVRWEEGLVLGADELVDEQEYFRAALERRSLTHDAFGVAWGLGLSVESTNSGPIVRVSPGVAYDGDGKVVVVREKEEVSSLLEAQAITQGVTYGIYLVFAERDAGEESPFQFCGQSIDPRSIEEYAFMVDAAPASMIIDQRRGPISAPHDRLAVRPDDANGRVLIGVVRYDNGKWEIIGRDKVEPDKAKHPTSWKADTQWIGLVGATISHPAAWSGGLGGPSRVAIELDREDGVHLHQRALAHRGVWFLGEDASAEAKIDADKLIVTVYGGQPWAGVEALAIAQAGVTVRRALTVNGESTFEAKGTFDKELVVTGNATLAAELKVEGKSTLKSVEADSLTVVNATTLHALTVEEPATFKKTVDVEDTLTVMKKVVISAGGSLEVFGPATVTGKLTVQGEAEIAGPAKLSQATILSGTANLSSATITTVSSTAVNATTVTAGSVNATTVHATTLDVPGVKVDVATGLTSHAFGIELVMVNPSFAHVGLAVAVDASGRIRPPLAGEGDKIIGVVARQSSSTGKAVVVVAGLVEAFVSGAVMPGQWLHAMFPPNAGKLDAPASGGDIGKLVAKAIMPAAAGKYLVLVALG